MILRCFFGETSKNVFWPQTALQKRGKTVDPSKLVHSSLYLLLIFVNSRRRAPTAQNRLTLVCIFTGFHKKQNTQKLHFYLPPEGFFAK